MTGAVTHLLGDVFEQLATLPDDHFDCVVTSPPYWGLRDYGVEGQLGLEPTLGEHLDVMVRVFAEVHRVLKPEGTLWLNYGDCYASSPNGRSAAVTKALGDDDRTFRDKPFSTVGPIYVPDAEAGDRRGGDCKQRSNEGSNHTGRVIAGGYLKPKDLCMVPNRVAIALQEWGWWVRSEIIWAKPNPMPESIKDRPATSHEKIFMLSKSARYFYDAEAVRQNMQPSSVARLAQDVEAQQGSDRANGGAKTNGPMKAVGGGRKSVRSRGLDPRHKDHPHTQLDDYPRGEVRNLRNWEPAPMQVWEIATRPFSEAHFATFPPELVERCLKAGCPPGGRVLDPFGGAGTTGLVADQMQLDATLIELNPAYRDISIRRIKKCRGETEEQPSFFGEIEARQ